MPIYYESYTDKALIKCIRKTQKRIADHESKIENPGKYVKDWDEKDVEYRKGIIAYWKKEIRNFNVQIKKAQAELERRGGK